MLASSWQKLDGKRCSRCSLSTSAIQRSCGERERGEGDITGVLVSEECGDGRVCPSGIGADAIDQLRVEVRMLRQLVEHHFLRRDCEPLAEWHGQL